MRGLVADRVHQPGGLEHEQPQLLDPHARLGDPVPDHALLGERLAEGDARVRARRTSARSPAPPRRSSACSGGSGPGPSRACAIANPSPSRADQVGRGHPHVAEHDLGVAAVVVVVVAEDLHAAAARTRRGCRGEPGSSTAGGAGSAAGSVLPITMKISACGFSAPVIHHLRPLITYSSPSRSMRVAMLVASEDATSGSVIANDERISPSSSGCSQRLLLLRGAEHGEHLHVAGVRRGAVQRGGRQVGCAR